MQPRSEVLSTPVLGQLTGPFGDEADNFTWEQQVLIGFILTLKVLLVDDEFILMKGLD